MLKKRTKRFVVIVGAMLAILLAFLFFRFGTLSSCEIGKQIANKEFQRKISADAEMNVSPFKGLARSIGERVVGDVFNQMSWPKCVYRAVDMALFGFGSDKSAIQVDNQASVPEDQSNKVYMGGWQVIQGISPLDDSKTVVIRKQVDILDSNRLGDKPVLVLRCKEAVSEVYVTTGRVLSRDYKYGTTHVSVRYDAEESKKKELSLSTDERGFFFDDPEGMIEKLETTEKFVVRYHPFKESPVTATFYLYGIEKHLSSLKGACPIQRQ